MAAPIDQVIPDVGRAIVAAEVRDAVAGELDGPGGNLVFQQRAAPGDFFHRMAVAVAGGKVHATVHVRRITAKGVLDPAHAFNELGPVGRREQPEAPNAVADRDLVSGLVLVLQLNELLDRALRLVQALLQPAHRQGESLALAAQLTGEFRHESAGQRGLVTNHVGQDDDQLARFLLQHPAGPEVGLVAVPPARGNAPGDPPEALDEGQAKHDRDGPQLAQLERDDGLVGGDEAAEVVGIDTPIDMRDQLQGDAVGAGVAGQRPARQPGKLPAVLPRKVSPGGPDLRFNEVEVVEQPVGGGGDALAFTGGGADQFVGGQERIGILRQSRQQAASAASTSR